MHTQFHFSPFSSFQPYFKAAVWRSSWVQISLNLVSLERFRCLVSIGPRASVSTQTSFEALGHTACEWINQKWLHCTRPLKGFFSSILSTNKASLLKRQMKNRRLSFSPYSMFSRPNEECLCLWPPTKLLTNNLLNSCNEIMVFGGSLLNHTLTGPFNMVGKAMHMILSRIPWRCIVDLNVAMWSQGFRFPSYKSKVGILNLEGKGWFVIDAVRESVLWMRSSTWVILLIESLISFMVIFIRSISLSNYGTLRWQCLWIDLLL